MDRLKNALPIVASAVLFCLAFPPFNLGLLVFVALVPWLVSLAQPGARGFRSGYLFGWIIVLEQMAFVQTITVRWTGSVALSFAPWIVCAGIGALYFGALGAILQRALARGWFWAIPLAWAGLEVCRSFIPGLAFPYFLVATPLWAYPMLIQTAYLGTIYFFGAWLVLINVLFVFYLQRTRFMVVRKYAIVASLLMMATLFRFVQPLEGTQRVIVAGQPGVDMAYGDPVERYRKLGNAVADIYRESKSHKTDLIVLPEGLAEGGTGLPPPTAFVVEPGVPILFGVRRIQDGLTYQSAYAFDGKWQMADKARLVVFGEYVPGRKFLPFLDAFKLPQGDLSPAAKTSAVNVGGLRVGPMICFESLFWDVAYHQVQNDAQLLAVMSIDDWYMGTWAPDQLRTGAVFRAVECDLPVVRAGALGYTMSVDQRGRVVHEAKLGETTALASGLMIPDHATPMPVRPLFPWAFGLSLPGLAVALWWPRKRASEEK